eukprot:357867-Pleurochrysis_carterae.AAC.1
MPTGVPPFAQFKPDHNWERPNMEATVHLWLPHFTLTRPADIDAAKAKWSKRLWQLPTDLAVDALPEDEKLKWPELPTCQAVRVRVHHSEII